MRGTDRERGGAELNADRLSDEILQVGEGEASRRHFDATNIRRLSFLLWSLLGVFAVYTLVLSSEGRVVLTGVAFSVVLADALVLRVRHCRPVTANVRQLVAAVLASHLVILQIVHWNDLAIAGTWYAVFAVLACRLRVTVGEMAAVHGALYAILAVHLVVMRLGAAFPVVELLSFGFLALVVLAVALVLVHRAQMRFLESWRNESLRHRDRLRMKQELEYAREIQLSMLPRQAPQVEWLDIAALSLPATEVGGDYYDYFDLGAERVAVVVGDVTGHGVASGLVLSGVRSGLNLLVEELAVPEQVLHRVNRMLKRTATPRMLMTLGLVVLDPDTRSATVATAGHPPVLWSRPGSRLCEVGRGALPLGAFDDTEYHSDRVGLERGDVLLLYSDGLVEAVGLGGEQYGWARLHGILAEQPATASAAEIRDGLLRDLWDFKGDVQQVDDVTMVVVRVH